MKTPLVRRVVATLLWGVLGLLSFAGVVAVILIGVLMVEEVRHCSPPLPDSTWVRECSMNAEVTAMLGAFGLPLLLPLPLVLLVRRMCIK